MSASGCGFIRLCPRNVLVKADANYWSGRMQMGGQVCAITQPVPTFGKQRGFDWAWRRPRPRSGMIVAFVSERNVLKTPIGDRN